MDCRPPLHVFPPYHTAGSKAVEENLASRLFPIDFRVTIFPQEHTVNEKPSVHLLPILHLPTANHLPCHSNLKVVPIEIVATRHILRQPLQRRTGIIIRERSTGSRPTGKSHAGISVMEADLGRGERVGGRHATYFGKGADERHENGVRI